MYQQRTRNSKLFAHARSAYTLAARHELATLPDRSSPFKMSPPPQRSKRSSSSSSQPLRRLTTIFSSSCRSAIAFSISFSWSSDTFCRSWPLRASMMSRFSTSLARASLTIRMRPRRSAASGSRIWLRIDLRASAVKVSRQSESSFSSLNLPPSCHSTPCPPSTCANLGLRALSLSLSLGGYRKPYLLAPCNKPRQQPTALQNPGARDLPLRSLLLLARTTTSSARAAAAALLGLELLEASLSDLPFQKSAGELRWAPTGAAQQLPFQDLRRPWSFVVVK